MKRRGGSSINPPMIDGLLIPDPRTWPTAVREWFHRVSGDCGPFGILIFDCGNTGAMYLHDAVTALGILGAEEAEWHTAEGYPVFEFGGERIAEFARRLTLCGYSVRVLQMAGKKEAADLRTRAEVVNIATARPQVRTVNRPEEAEWE
jgi:hypothetical protein